jgi:hypothetical protein
VASAGASVAVGAGVFAAVPVVGWAVGIGAALIDTYYIMPALQGRKRDNAVSPRLLDSPVGSNGAGASRVWALGSRCRVPCHVIWQDEKTRETSSSSSKAGTQTNYRRVLIDAAVCLNDRPTRKLLTLYGNGALLLYESRNLQSITSSTLVLSVLSANRLRIAATETSVPSFTSLLQLNSYVELVDWVQTAGPNILTQPFKVIAIADHGSLQPSYIDIERRYDAGAPNLSTVVATAGTGFAPAKVRRIDDTLYSFGIYSLGSASSLRAGFISDSHLQGGQLFSIGERARLEWFNTTTQQWQQFQTYSPPNDTRFLRDGFESNPTPATYVQFYYLSPPQSPPGPVGTYQPYRARPFVDQGFAFGVFAEAWTPSAYFYGGSETQIASATISNAVGAADTPAYRGLSYQVLPKLLGTLFGDAMPQSLEAVIEVDAAMTYGQAIAIILGDRCDLPVSAINVDGLQSKPLGGLYLRGPVPAITAIQPILVAGQLMVQDRDGVLAFTEFANADEQTIENGATFSDFGTRLDGETAADDKITVEDMATEDLPTKIGIRHQDPDNQYADGYQFFGLRNPEGVDHTNEQEIDLAQMVLTRQEAANLAAVLLRRAWVNRRRYRFTLPASYIHLLESDLLTWTDDDGTPHVGRIIQRDIGSDFRVGIVCIAEDLELANYVGSPTQSAAGTPPISIPGPASVDVVIVDAPATREGQNRKPGLHIAVGYNGGPWAGAAIYESVDGTTYDLVDIVGKRAVTGELATSLGSATPAEQVGVAPLVVSAQSVDVQFTAYSESQITSRTTKEVVSGSNWVALVKPDGTTEIAAFTSAVALGGGLFTLSGWLRGLRGTADVAQNTVAACPAGTRIVLLNGDTYYREFAGEIAPTALSYKIVPGGLSLDDVEPINFVQGRRNALPLPPRTITKAIDVTTLTARFTVTHNWSRAVLTLGTQPPHPMDEPLESYRFTIYDATGTQIRRIKTITASATGTNTIRDRWIEYTSAEQSADGYTPGPSTLFTVSVEQLGEFGAGPRWFKKF